MTAHRACLAAVGIAALMLIPLPSPVQAQTPPATIGERYVPSPWWMRDPVIASLGYVRTEIPANRARFGASFLSVERSAADASRAAAERVRALSRTLGEYGVDTVRVETSITTQPLYDQYRDENGVLRDNVRADRIERYQATASVVVTVRDVAVLERIYATVTASQPTSVSPVSFSLEPTNEVKTWLQGEAVRDAARRARTAASNAGASLGAVRVIDPTGRACQTDILAGWPSYGGSSLPTSVEADEVVASSARFAAAAPPPPPPPSGQAPSEAQIEAARLALQPPLQQLTDQACVVYGLN